MYIIKEINLIIPELIIAGSTCFILLLDLFLMKKRKWITYFLALLSLLIAGCFSYGLLNIGKKIVFNGSFVVDNFSSVTKMIFFLIYILTFIYTRKYLLIRKAFSAEFYVLCLFSLLGMMFLVSAGNLLILYLGLELLVLPLYLLASYVKENVLSLEASMKYFIMGALASGLMLYGISLIYGFTGTFDIAKLFQILSNNNIETTHSLVGLHCGILFILVGCAFKLGAAPFHLWVPDVYSGTSLPVTLLISAAPKLAALGMAFRILANAFIKFGNFWHIILCVMAILSLAIGNISAICQTNLKRMLAYSTIAHVGFILLAIIAGVTNVSSIDTINANIEINNIYVGFNAAMSYTIIYIITIMVAFGLMIIISYKAFESENIEDFKGLGYRSPLLAFLMLLVLFSLAGIPPLAGFYAKFFVIKVLIDQGYLLLPIIAIIFSVIAAFYYLKIVKIMYFDKATEAVMEYRLTGMNFSAKILLSFQGIALLVLGMYPVPIIYLCEKAFY